MSENTFQRITTKKYELYLPNEVVEQIRAEAIDDFAERLKPIIDKGWTNSEDLRRWCEKSIDEITEWLKLDTI